MKSKNVALVAAGAVAAIVLVWSQGWAQSTRPAASAPAPTAKIATCDLIKVMNGYLRVPIVVAEFENRGKQLKAEDDKRSKDIQALQEVMSSLDPKSKEYEARLNDMQKQVVERKVWQELQTELTKREQRRRTEEMYREVLDVVAVVAQERGFDMVVTRDSGELATNTMEELLDKISQRKCLYADPAIDLTDQVLERINRPYQK